MYQVMRISDSYVLITPTQVLQGQRDEILDYLAAQGWDWDKADSLFDTVSGQA